MYSLEVTKRQEPRHNSGEKARTIEFSIEESTRDLCFATFFKEYDNRYKYCNDVHFSLGEEDKKAFGIWISNISNYANNGGDMW